MMLNIRKSLSLKLSLSILLLAVLIFSVSLGLLFLQSRYIIRQEAVGRAGSALGTAMQRICLRLNAIETATNAWSWQVTRSLQPDSLLQLSHSIVLLNSYVDGCSISAEPNVFPQYGRYFSVYSIRQADSIATAVEEQYEYFAKDWYKSARDLGKPCWIDFYGETDSLNMAIASMIASYSKPLYDDMGRLVAVISTDISLRRLSKVISAEEKPYRHAYFVMLNAEGSFIVHPDSTRLFRQSIGGGEDPRRHADLVALGHEMTAGNQGSMTVVDLNGVRCLVCYQPVPHTSWSLAVVCPESDILRSYHRLSFIVVPLLIAGLLAILLMVYRMVGRVVRPLNQLLAKTQAIASGNMEVHIARSKREDAVGRLQNSFATMLQSLNFHMGSVSYTTEQARRRNDELVEATRRAREADEQKTAFIQNVTHQIRTPLNIIMGFAQILDAGQRLSVDELKSIADTMEYNSKLLCRLVKMLYDSSDTGLSAELSSGKIDLVPCNGVAREAIGYIQLRYPALTINFRTEVPDDYCMQTNRVYLLNSLREILYNSAKYSDGQHVSLSVVRGAGASAIRFVIEDTGKGIDDAYRGQMFHFFTKVDDLSEGLGLGLPLAKRHACNLGGDLTLDEGYHDGCRFILELPIAAKQEVTLPGVTTK